MSDDMIFFVFLVAIPAGLALVCGGAQWALARWLNGKAPRIGLLGLIPGVTGAGVLYALVQVLTLNGWDLLGWSFLLGWAGAAFVGAAVGWGLGCFQRRKRKEKSL